MAKSKGKRITLKASLRSYIEEVMATFGLESESEAVNLVVGSCSTKPISWLALKSGETPPPPPGMREAVPPSETSEPTSEDKNVLDLLSDDLNALAA
jgi:hypothetical protein